MRVCIRCFVRQCNLDPADLKILNTFRGQGKAHKSNATKARQSGPLTNLYIMPLRL